VLLVVIIQVVTAFGAGAWFPYAAPGLWMGMGGAAAA
jgi:ABC-2 type transport system permease protein